ncbi:M28 family peptidase [Mesoterricola silvestris]|uniref:Aminopeptidase n=1 Tax=Mesoterricola silvestris TaxID=2927979 RepID=A0AA48H8V5_9BACT|nr:M28 family peptidase [Mesoterricola silvestris]BDU73923.1 aminopeptidase [Mesoterricola silvestris]
MRLPLYLSLALALGAQVPPTAKDMAGHVESARLRRTVERLAAFGTRHSLSKASTEARGIVAARNWLIGETRDLAMLPGSRLIPFEDRFIQEPGPRVPKATEMVNVGVLLPALDPSRVKDALVVCAHYDSRASDVMDAESDAPGAVDNASGVALAFEMAHVMCADRTAVNVYFVATAGEEQGLLGAAHLARRLKAEGVNVIAMLAADTVGNTSGPGGAKAGGTVRIFSEGVPAAETEAQKRAREALGGENDSPSREFARYLKRFGERFADQLEMKVMLRRDRVGRGGDHLAFNREGFPAARVTETQENFDRQHQIPRVEGGRTYGDSPAFFDPGYCAKITREMVGAFHGLALAPEAPRNVTLSGAATPDARLSWTPITDPRVASMVVYRRSADAVAWQEDKAVPVGDHADLPGVGTDNFFFAVATRDRDGNESMAVAPTRVP